MNVLFEPLIIVQIICSKQGMLMITWMIPALAFLLTLTFIPAQTKVKSAQNKQKKGGIDWSKLGHMFSNGDVPYLMFMRVLSSKNLDHMPIYCSNSHS